MEFLPGFASDAENTLNENIADMGGVKNVLALAQTIDNFDYDVFFRTFAAQAAVSVTRQGARRYLLYDEHSVGRVRVNRLLSLFDAFYETYDVQPGDAMYVAPEERVSVW